jgi:hypothetical protein
MYADPANPFTRDKPSTCVQDWRVRESKGKIFGSQAIGKSVKQTDKCRCGHRGCIVDVVSISNPGGIRFFK